MENSSLTERNEVLKFLAQLKKRMIDGVATIYVAEIWSLYSDDSRVSFHYDLEEVEPLKRMLMLSEELHLKKIEISWLMLLKKLDEKGAEELFNHIISYANTIDTFVNEGCDIDPNTVIVEWRWVKYPGYSRELIGLHTARELGFKKERDLITGHEESTGGYCYSILTEELSEDSIHFELSCTSWKWSYFQDVDCEELVRNFLNKHNL